MQAAVRGGEGQHCVVDEPGGVRVNERGRAQVGDTLRSQLASPKGQPAARGIDDNGAVEEAHRSVARGRRRTLIASCARYAEEYRQCCGSGADDGEPVRRTHRERYVRKE